MPPDSKPRLPALNPASVPRQTGTRYPGSITGPFDKRIKQALGDALGLTQFGVNLVELPPGAASALRHWHRCEDEFIYVLEGELTLITDGGEQVLGPGMAAGFPAGKADGHHLVNRGDKSALYLEAGNRPDEDDITYPDDDLVLTKRAGNRQFANKKGQPLGPGVG